MSQRQIRVLSHRLSAFCSALIVLLPAVCITYWALAPLEMIGRQFLGEPAGIADLGWAQRLVALLLTALVIVPLSLALASLRRLLRLYVRGKIFEVENVAAIGQIGRWLAWLGVAQFLDATLIPLALTLGNPPGHRILAINLSAGAVEAILLGAVLLVIARVMDEARVIADEQAQTV